MNEDLDQKSLLRRYELELKRLREELEERSRYVVGTVVPECHGSSGVPDEVELLVW